MRINSVVWGLTLACGAAWAQQHVVRLASDPRTIGSGPMGMATSCGSSMPIPGSFCDVTVYNDQETDIRIAAAKTAAIAECKQNIDVVKGDLAKDINNLPSVALDALKAQIKEEIKAEVLKELIDEIKTGKLPLSGGLSQPKHN